MEYTFKVGEHTITMKVKESAKRVKWGGLRDRYVIGTTIDDCKPFDIIFYNSIINLGKPLKEIDFLHILDCNISDAVAGDISANLADFMYEFGYNESNKTEARTAYHECINACKKYKDRDIDFYELGNLVYYELGNLVNNK